jgi:hypothetical protein
MRIVAIVALGLLAAACQTVGNGVVAGPDASDPGAAVPPADYRSTISQYVSRRPVEPTSWRERNEGVAPRPKQ